MNIKPAFFKKYTKGSDFLKKAFLLFFGAAFLYFAIFIISEEKTIEAVNYYYGNSGSVITRAQTKLKAWGYYKGTADGVFGYNTYKAIRYFQSKNSLTVNGVLDSATQKSLGIITSSSSSSSWNTNKNLLSHIITGEARGEPYTGQVAIGAVIINRTRDPRFPATIAGVIYQPGAFTAVDDGQINLEPVASASKAAVDSLNGWDPSGGAIYYYNPATTTNKWIWSRPIIKVIGKHNFCK